ncbi:MAG: hypothetical protein U1A78_09120 [Polyangia bacterium]
MTSRDKLWAVVTGQATGRAVGQATDGAAGVTTGTGADADADADADGEQGAEQPEQPAATASEAAEPVQELVRAAIDYVHRATGCRPEFLDRSEESLAFVDHYIDQVRGGEHTAPAMRPEVRTLAAAALGVYLGEVMRLRFGGRWLALPDATPLSARSRVKQPAGRSADDLGRDQEDLEELAGKLPGDPRAWRLQLAAAPVVCDPIGMAASALRELDELGEDSGADEVGFAVPSAYSEPLHEALARVPPVEVSYFYSLTGRFETLSYAVEILADLQRKDAEDAAQRLN